jgi:hypothetical protein
MHPCTAVLQREIAGQVLLPDHDGHHQARRVWNAMVDKRPAVIAAVRALPTWPRRCASAATMAWKSASAEEATPSPAWPRQTAA